MKLLFVDDEPLVLSGIENALIFADDDWDADFATSGEEAIEMLGSTHYDLLVTDMKMPGLTGADVLEWAKANRPDVLRLVLSGEIDAHLAERAMPLVHEFVPKPCDPDDLFEIIDRVYGVSQQLEGGTVRDVLGSLDALPSQPDLHIQINDAISRDEGIGAVAAVISRDLAIASSVIKTANSAFYGFRTAAETVRDAVSRLGIETVRGIVLNAEVSGWVSPELADSVSVLNEHSARVAEIVRHLVGQDVPQASLAALLHDIGSLIVIARFPEHHRELNERLADPLDMREEYEREALGATHSEIGAYMLQMWNADQIVVETALHHHDRASGDESARRIIDAILASDVAIYELEDVPPGLDPALVERARELVAESDAA